MEKDDKSWPWLTQDQLAGNSVDTSLRLLVRDHQQLVSRVASCERALRDAYGQFGDMAVEVDGLAVTVGRLEMAYSSPTKPVIQLVCGECAIAGVRIYRPYGESYKPKDNCCSACVPDAERHWFVPCILSADGAPWGYFGVPEDDIASFLALPEHPEAKFTWSASGRWLPVPEKCPGS
jgi:hypothetical protein